MSRHDIRLDVGLFSHPKTRKLEKRLGAEGVLSLIRLWCHAGHHRKKGNLFGMDNDDISLASGWSGDSDHFVSELSTLGLLDRNDDGTFSIHDWEGNQPWAFGSQERSESAKKASVARWHKTGSDAESCDPVSGMFTTAMRGASEIDAGRIENDANRNAPSPSPSPSPSPKPIDQSQHPSGPAKKASPDPAEWPDDLLPVLEELKTHGADHTDLACPEWWRSLIAWSDTQTPPLDLRPELAGYLAWNNSQAKSGQHKNLKRGFRNWCATRIRWRERDGIRQAAGGRRYGGPGTAPSAPATQERKPCWCGKPARVEVSGRWGCSFDHAEGEAPDALGIAGIGAL